MILVYACVQYEVAGVVTNLLAGVMGEFYVMHKKKQS